MCLQVLLYTLHVKTFSFFDLSIGKSQQLKNQIHGNIWASFFWLTEFLISGRFTQEPPSFTPLFVNDIFSKMILDP